MAANMHHRAFCLGLAALASVTVAACGDEAREEPTEILTQDPLLARALHDPLMVDPDLAWRNEANAAIAFRDGHPLPPFEANEFSRERAREASRIELLSNGPVPDLPAAQAGAGEPSLAGLATAPDIIRAVGSRTDCIDRVDGRLGWSAQMPPASAIMPHGMVQQAAGVDVDNCVIRVVRYLTPVSPEDALEYHFTKADRARFRIERFAEPEAQLRAERRDEQLSVHVRSGPGGLTAVDVVHWRK
jgi:hypothetical protein